MITPEQEAKIEEWKKQNNYVAPSQTPKKSAFDMIDEKVAMQQTSQSPFEQKVEAGIENYGKVPVIGGVLKGMAKVGQFLTGSEQKFGQDIGQAGYLMFGGQKNIDEVSKKYLDAGNGLLPLIKKTTDPVRKEQLAKMAIEDFKNAGKTGEDILGEVRTNGQILGDAGGVLADILLAGTYGKATVGMKSFELGTKAIEPVAKEVAKQTTGQILKKVGVETAKQTAKGGAIGYGMDVTQNLQEGKTGGEALTPGLGTAIGVATPLVIGGVKVTKELLKNSDNAGRVINSLIKPLQKDFAYGKNPGKAVAEEGIVANSLDELETKITEVKQKVGKQLGSITSNLEGKVSVDLSKITEPIDMAIEQAQKTPETNKALIERLNGIKNDLINYIGDGKNLTFAESIDAKGVIGDLTKWTGNATDDKFINKALKQTYGMIDGEVMSKIKSVDPELATQVEKLNDKYGSLISAENATKYRNILSERQNLISMPVKVGTVTGLITSVASGGAAIPTILAGVSSAILDKAMASPAFKTRLASWMATESPSVLNALYQKNPAIRNILVKLVSTQNPSPKSK